MIDAVVVIDVLKLHVVLAIIFVHNHLLGKVILLQRFL